MNTEWLKKYPVKTIKRDERIFNQGDPVVNVFYILKGICSRTKYCKNGTELVTKYYFPGDILMVWGILKGEKEYPATAIAMKEVTYVIIPACELKQRLETDFAFYKDVTTDILRNNQYVFQLYQKKSNGSAVEIICYTVLSLSRPTPAFGLCLNKVFTINEIAKHLRLHRITVSHIVNALLNENIVQKCPAGLRIINAERLRSYAEGDEILHYNE